MMHIAGGLYHELCYMPDWDAVFGSGGRAAAAVASLSPSSTLHTYADDPEGSGIASLEALGIEVRTAPRATAIIFAYFHPLSRPHIQPSPDRIVRQPSIRVEGKAVLRFGFLEGDAVVNAGRAVYDPQTWRDPAPFGANGSIAGELAIVLNELELRSASGQDDMGAAAAHLIDQQGAAAVVVKGGTRGATVFERGGSVGHVPAFRSSRVFKIGTGDVFSALFAYQWTEAHLPPVEAADLASRSVAAYCSTGRLPLVGELLRSMSPVGSAAPGLVALEGAVNTMGRRYTMEEARFRLREIGVEVTSLALDCIVSEGAKPAAVLVLADGLDGLATDRVRRAQAAGMPVVVLRESGVEATSELLDDATATVTDDFTSALYFVTWAAAAERDFSMKT